MSWDPELLFLHDRNLQFVLPDYTSPPLPDALAATPPFYRDDAVIDAMRAADAAGNCTTTTTAFLNCQIPFEPLEQESFDRTSPVGVILYGGGLVDPRGYSVLAQRLADDYGLPVVIPVFHDDLQFVFGTCNTGRLALAQAAYPMVEKWVLAGHSFGGVAAMTDLWIISQNATTDFEGIGGMVLMASDVQQGLGCGDTDYSLTTLPMASVTATLDGVINNTRLEANQKLLPPNTTLFVTIQGGNHGQFGSYNDTERTTLLGQVDGVATIAPEVQWEMTIGAIVDVASRAGLDLPQKVSAVPTMAPTTTFMDSSIAATPPPCCWMWTVLLGAWMWKRIMIA